MYVHGRPWGLSIVELVHVGTCGVALRHCGALSSSLCLVKLVCDRII